MYEKVSREAENGSEKMKQLMGTLDAIDKAAAHISGVIKLIDGHCLPDEHPGVNAAVEAARGGAHGKGFAVVAEEVKNLAAKSAEGLRRRPASF
jgi:methyl-accepting chemotaxis protein